MAFVHKIMAAEKNNLSSNGFNTILQKLKSFLNVKM